MGPFLAPGGPEQPGKRQTRFGDALVSGTPPQGPQYRVRKNRWLIRQKPTNCRGGGCENHGPKLTIIWLVNRCVLGGSPSPGRTRGSTPSVGLLPDEPSRNAPWTHPWVGTSPRSRRSRAAICKGLFANCSALCWRKPGALQFAIGRCKLQRRRLGEHPSLQISEQWGAFL